VTLSSETMMKLMAYADGELEGRERLEVEELLATDAAAAEVVVQIAGLGGFVKLGHDDRDAQAIASFDVADAVMAKVKGADADRTAKVVSISSASSASSALSALSARRSANRTKVIGGAVAALALAASVFLLARPGETPMGASPGAGGAVAANPPPAPVVSDPASPGVEVSAVESPGQTVSVFYLPSGNELTTSVVVWVDETGEK
jgi:anti-sigma factor RsiW